MTKSLIHNFLPLLLLVVIGVFLFSGCATFPALPNVKQYNHCIPVYSTHTPPDVAKLESIVNMVKKNPSLLEKALPANSIIDTVGKNSPAIGTGLASTISAIKGDISIASVIGSTVMGTVSGFGAMRSEGREQARVDWCVPDDFLYASYKDKNVEIIIGRNGVDIDAIKREIQNVNG
jgi:hypothetical protein